jgi:aarF domain-containing kinase
LDELLAQSTTPALSKVREISWRVAEPAIPYNPQNIEAELWGQPWIWLVRNIQFIIPFSIFFSRVVFDILTGQEGQNRRERAEELLGLLAAQSPAVIKAGQALASRSDLLPAEYLEQLQKLQDRCPPYPSPAAFELFKSEFGQDIDDVFDDLDPVPIAAASIGQVYRARLKTNGAEVAIKIQRPNCQAAIAIDLYIMRWYAGVVEGILKIFNRDIGLVSVIDDFGDLIYREIDYKAEMVNGQRFAELYSTLPNVFVPKVYSDYCTTKVLTMEWVQGTKLNDKQALSNLGLDGSELVDTLVQCSLRQLLENGFFHADPHAGNLLATPDGQICYLDFGMVSYVEPGQRYSIIEAVVHLVNRDFSSLAELYRRMGFIPQNVDTAPIRDALEQALPDVLNAPVRELNFKSVVSKLGDVMYKFPFSLPPFYIAIIRCLGVLEGLAIEVDEDFRIIQDAYPYIASRLLTDNSAELQQALQQLLFQDGRPRWERLQELLEKAATTGDYDAGAAINQLLDYVLSPQAVQVRELLITEMVTLTDRLGSEAVDYLLEIATVGAQPGRSGEALDALRNLLTNLQQADLAAADVSAADNKNNSFLGSPTPEMLAFAKVVRTTVDNGSIDGERLSQLIRRLLREPVAQDLLSRYVAEVTENASAGIVKRLFNV